MPVDRFLAELKVNFPEISRKTDVIHINTWGCLDSKSNFSWLENLARAINNEMANDVPAHRYQQLFSFLSKQYQSDDPLIKEYIDVSFVENLFWKIPKDKAASYWVILPNNLKLLYINFHQMKPI